MTQVCGTADTPVTGGSACQGTGWSCLCSSGVSADWPDAFDMFVVGLCSARTTCRDMKFVWPHLISTSSHPVIWPYSPRTNQQRWRTLKSCVPLFQLGQSTCAGAFEKKKKRKKQSGVLINSNSWRYFRVPPTRNVSACTHSNVNSLGIQCTDSWWQSRFEQPPLTRSVVFAGNCMYAGTHTQTHW